MRREIDYFSFARFLGFLRILRRSGPFFAVAILLTLTLDALFERSKVKDSRFNVTSDTAAKYFIEDLVLIDEELTRSVASMTENEGEKRVFSKSKQSSLY